jgi:hypothetical protein
MMTLPRRKQAPRGRIRLGVVGGGEGAFIGAVHRIASRIDDEYVLVAGALSSTPEKAMRSGLAIGLDPARKYRRWRQRGGIHRGSSGILQGGWTVDVVMRRSVVVRGNDSVDAAQRWSQPPCDGLRCGRGRSSAMMRCHVREGARPPSPLLLDFRYLRRDEHA